MYFKENQCSGNGGEVNGGIAACSFPGFVTPKAATQFFPLQRKFFSLQQNSRVCAAVFLGLCSIPGFVPQKTATQFLSP